MLHNSDTVQDVMAIPAVYMSAVQSKHVQIAQAFMPRGGDHGIHVSQCPVPAAVGCPPFSDVSDKVNVARIVDTPFGMTRTEVNCANTSSTAVDMCVSVCVFIVTNFTVI